MEGKEEKAENEIDLFLKNVGKGTLLVAAGLAILLAKSPKARSFIWGGLMGMGAKGMRDEWNRGIPPIFYPIRGRWQR